MAVRSALAAACVLAAAGITGCAGNGAVITDGTTCNEWLGGNGRDAYLQAHNLREYDAGETGRRPETAAVGRAMTDICEDEPSLPIDEALRRAATGDRAPG